MQIILEGAGKKYNREWIFKGIDKSITTGCPIAVIGPNGSGKSTLMLIISGWTLPSAGSVSFVKDENAIPPEEFYKSIDLIAPYTELVEELTLAEFLKFHFSFKSLKEGINIKDVINKCRLEGNEEKFVKHFSSGMKQRLKLSLGLYSSTPVLLLDEPTTNLDQENKKWYYEEIMAILENKAVIIASNQPEEYTFVEDFIKIENYK
jgi:ABC-type multidrug transport system ATPase subunit